MMRRLFVIGFLLIYTGIVSAQNEPSHTQDPSTQYNGVGGSIGASIFKGKPYLLLGFAPQFEFGKWGIGLDGAIRISDQGTLRKEDWDQLYDYLRFINFIRFGKPEEDYYARVGGIARASLGHGTIVDNYSNLSSYDNRRIGLWAKMDIGFVGGQLITSDVFAKSLIAVRPFTRPFHLIPAVGNVWLLRNVEFGATASFDYDSNAVRIIPNREPYVKHFYDTVGDVIRDSVVVVRDSAQIISPLRIFGVDASVMVYDDDGVQGRVYGDFIKIVNFNEGYIIGARASFYTGDETYWDVRAERAIFKNYFLPNYYNSFYERERFNDDVGASDYITKATRLSDTATGQGNGTKFGLFYRHARAIEASFMYAHLDNRDASDLMEINLTFPEIWWKFFGAVTYQRRNIDGPNDYFKFDENTLAHARLSVQPFPFIVLSAIGRWSFTRDENNRVQTQGIIEPKVTFIARF